jgi:hypothetical protein
MWEATPWADRGNHVAAEHWREQFLEFINRGDLVLPFTLQGQAVAIPFEKEGTQALRILNLAGIRKGNAVPQAQCVQVTINAVLNDVTVLTFMNGFGSADINQRDQSTVITLDLNLQSTLVWGESEETVYADIIQPQAGTLYLMGREIMHTSLDAALIIGPIAIDASTNGHLVEFYIDEELGFSDAEPPFEWFWDERIIGSHIIRVVAHGRNGNSDSDTQPIWIANL